MAKFKFTLSIGYAGADHRETYEIDDEDFEGLSEAERDKVIEEHWQEWSQNYIDGGWDEIE